MHQPINAKTNEAINDYLLSPGQSLGLIGQKWLNKGHIATDLASKLLSAPISSLPNYPYFLTIKDRSITIDDIRSINDFIILKVPIKKDINRIIILEQAQDMTLEAQNALLKNLEEPPSGTVFILTAESANSLLPTITSRLNVINVYKPARDDLTAYYLDQGYGQKDIDQAMLLADGLPGLIDQLLSDKDNPFSKASTQARTLLTSTTIERLSSINDLAKNKAELKNILFVIKQMAKIGLTSSDPKSSRRWQKILAATLESENKLGANVQVKLLLNEYMLALG